VSNFTCAACPFNGAATRPHVSQHPRARLRHLPKLPGEVAWLERLGIKPRTHHA